jgi:hypothetical protein
LTCSAGGGSKISLYSAQAPEGPWTFLRYIIERSDYSWEGGFIEGAGGLYYWNGVFYLLYDGRLPHYSFCSIGVAVSLDLEAWYNLQNPLISPSLIPREFDNLGTELPKALIEDGVFCLFGRAMGDLTNDTPQWSDRVSKLALYVGIIDGQEWKISPTILHEEILSAGASTVLADCKLIRMAGLKSLNVSVKSTYHASATVGANLRIFTSADGVSWDTEPTEDRTLVFAAGETVQKTFTPLDVVQRARFVKIVLRNLDSEQAISDISVTATLGV